MMADMDKLQPINDLFGHDEGSAAIVNTAELLRQSFREADIIARLGGDEFSVLIINAVEDTNRIIAERLQSNFDKHNRESGKSYQLSISFGIVAIEFESAASIEQTMRQADEAMYEHKRSKRDWRG